MKRKFNQKAEDKKPAKPGKVKKLEQVAETEPLSNFQTPLTGRVDPALNGKPHPTNGKPNASLLNISKVKIVKGQFLEISYSKLEKDATSAAISEKHESPVHADFRTSLRALAIHLALRCDYITAQQVKSIDKYDQGLAEKFHVSGISIGSGKSGDGVVLTGHKITKSGEAIILNTPFTRYEEDSKTAYRYIDDLQNKVDAVISEVQLYLGGKRGDLQQLALELPDTEEKEEEEAIEEE
jgi:hypothetical protein